MNKRKYYKNSIIGKIYKWVTGDYLDTDSCNVRNVVLFKAPIKALFGLDLFYISGLDVHVQLWFVWATIYQIYVLMNWQRLVVDKGPLLGIEAFFVLFLPFIILLSIIEGIVVMIAAVVIIAGGGSFLAEMIDGAAKKVGLPTDDIIKDWWDDIKNKVCKPVRWVE